MSDLVAYAVGGSSYSLLADSFHHEFSGNDAEKHRSSILLLLALYTGMALVGCPSFLPGGSAHKITLTNTLIKSVICLAVLDLAKDFLVLLSIASVGAGTSTVLQSASVVLSALGRRAIFDQPISQARWASIVAVLVGVYVMAQAGEHGQNSGAMLGVAAALGAALVSSIATLVTEYTSRGEASAPPEIVCTGVGIAGLSSLWTAHLVGAVEVSVGPTREVLSTSMAGTLTAVVCAAALNNWGFFRLVARAGASFGSLVRAARSALTMLVAAALFCNADSGSSHCLTLARFLGASTVIVGTVSFSTQWRNTVMLSGFLAVVGLLVSSLSSAPEPLGSATLFVHPDCTTGDGWRWMSEARTAFGKQGFAEECLQGAECPWTTASVVSSCQVSDVPCLVFLPAVEAEPLLSSVNLPASVTVDVCDPYRGRWDMLTARHLGESVRPFPRTLTVTHVTDTAKFYVAFEERATKFELSVIEPEKGESGSSDADIVWIRKQVTWLMQQDLDSVGADPTKVPPGQMMNIVPRFAKFLATKDSLCQRLREANARGSLPCFLWPSERDEWVSYAQAHQDAVYIFKEIESSNALGTSLVHGVDKTLEQLKAREGVLQLYVIDPVTVPVRDKQYKIDLRVYALAPSWDPLRVYVSRLGYVRVAGAPYTTNLANVNAHLTNSAQNSMYLRLTFGELEAELERQGMDFQLAWQAILEAMHDAVAAFRHDLSCSNADYPYPCGDGNFQSFAADIILDRSMNVYMAEFNADPSMKLRSAKVNGESDVRFRDEFSMLGLLPGAPVPAPFTSAEARAVCSTYRWSGDTDCAVTLVQHAAAVEAMCREQAASGSYERVYPSTTLGDKSVVRASTPAEQARVALDELLLEAFTQHCG
uniref:Tubulin--tyrosine ligase-like protein 5 n=1 Tax=Sexangularia sp. CB-2014 TaxID=1486929 RepID=A0A7S1VP09_9EUKA